MINKNKMQGITPEIEEKLFMERKNRAETYLDKISKQTKIDEKLIKELQERLVQACIDFINEKNIGDLERVEFNVDALQDSAPHKHWTPYSDSYINCYGLEYDKDFFTKENFLGSYC